MEAHEAAFARGLRVEGHFAGASAHRLSALVAAGGTSDHEPITAAEVVDRLRLGLWVMLRHSSLRPDLPDLLAAITKSGVDTFRLMLTTDGPTPAFISDHGFQDEMLRIAVQAGVPPIRALQMASLNPAVYYRAEHEIGGIALGRRADLLVLSNLTDFRPERVMAGGCWITAAGRMLTPLPAIRLGELAVPLEWTSPDRLAEPGLYAARHDGGDFPVIEMVSVVITRRSDKPLPSSGGRVELNGTRDLLHIALVDRCGRWITRGVVAGLGGGIEGLATSANVAYELPVCGRDPAAMAVAARRLAARQGGMALAEQGEVRWELPLPLAGQMSHRPLGEVAEAERMLVRLMRARGYRYHDPVFTLKFLPGDFLPGVRITPGGLFDVLSECVIRPPDCL